jgi:NADPH-dependent 2,4-dienoyl-CoA reductase/sulfur reductase-like enzyme
VNPSETCDLAIVGGGPAGLSAAIVAGQCGLDVRLLDEQPRLGGQIYRQPPVGFRVDGWLTGRLYRRGKALLERAERLPSLHHVSEATVWGLFPAESKAEGSRHRVLFERAGVACGLNARHVLLATGCYEMPVPFPGWQRPGVMSAGGIQTLLKSQRVAAGRNIVLAGSHPLLLVAADQLLAAGVRVAAIVFTQSGRTLMRMLASPAPLLAALPQLLYAAHCLNRIRRARVPVLLGHAVAEALGTDAVEAVRVSPSDFRGESRMIPCDAVGMCYGFLASSELARQAGAQSNWESGSGWVVASDEFLRTSVPNLSVAGELIGVAGAEAAALSGEIAALGISSDAGALAASEASARSGAPRRRLRTLRRFAAALAGLTGPSSSLLSRLATPTTLLCRCEEVTVGALGEALRDESAAASASSVKLLTRVGMGLCQGRMCELAVRRLIGEYRDCPLEQIPGYEPRPPVKPIALGALATQANGISPEHGSRVA